MNTKLKILIAEHNSNDIELLHHELKIGGIKYVSEVVQNEQDYVYALREFVPDIILSDYTFPSFDGPAAFKIRQEKAPNTPFIFVSGTIGEENSIELIKNGVTDFVVKDRIFTINTKLNRALKDAKDWHQKDKIQKDLKINENRLNQAQAIAKVGSWETDLLTLEVMWSKETFRIFGLDPDNFQIAHKNFLEFVHPDDREKVNTAFIRSQDKDVENGIVHRIVTPGGIIKIIEECWRVIRDDAGKAIRAVGTCQDITERKKAEENMRNSEGKRRLIMNAALDAIICIDTKGEITFWNPQAETIFGWKENEVVGKPLSGLIIPEQYRSRHNEGMANYLKTGKGPALNKLMELSAINRNGDEFPIELTIMPIKQGSEEFFCAFIRDITKRKNSEKALQAAYTEKNDILESIDDGFFALDKNSIVTYWNKKAEVLLNAKKEDVVGKNLHEMFTNPDSIIFYDNYQKAIRENITVHFEAFSKRSNKWFSVSAFPSIIGLSVYFKDVTESKESEEKLKKSNERYQLISKATNDMVWDWDLVTDEVYRNKEGWKKIFKTAGKEIENGLTDEWDKRIHPEDQGKVRLMVEEIHKAEKDFFEVECRVLRDDGTYAYIHDRGNIIRDGEGLAVRIIGATQDITERKEAELKVIKSELRFKSLIQNSSDLTSIIDQKGYYLYSSPAVKKILGYEPEMIVGENAFSFIHPDDIIAIKAHLAKPKTDSFTSAPPFRFKNVMGEWRWLESKVTDMNADPDVQGYVFNSRDVTERKIAEEEIEKLSVIAKETVNAVIITDPEERIVWVNEGFTQITEFELAEVLGKRPGDFLQGKETNPAMVRFMRQKIKNIEPFECDIINYSKSGRKYWLRIQCQPQFDEAGKLKSFFAIETDITKEKDAEGILKASEERYRYLFNNNPASIFIWDIDTLKILEVNKTASDEYGYSRKEFLCKTILDHGVAQNNDKIKAFISEVREKEDFKSVNISKHLNKSGEVMYMNIASHRIQYKGKTVILGLATNVTEKISLEKLLEKERVIKQKQITDAVISAQEEERQEIGRELHDNINQILATSRLYVGMVKNESPIPLPSLEETDNLITMAINEIRSLSHSMISPSLNESEMVEALELLIKVITKTSPVKISLESEGFDENIIPDKLKLTIYRIVQEQFNNILKYAKARNVLVQLIQINQQLIISIKDDGVGFDTTIKSTGVGLLNIKTRASLFDGDLVVISSPGKGCELRVTFN